MKYGELNLGQVEAIVNKLGGMEGVKRFLSGESVIKEAEYRFDVWKTIKLGTGLKTSEDFRRALADGGFTLTDWASDILGTSAFTAATEETEVDLVKVTVAELGFKTNARRDHIYERAKELGLELCPPEVGPQLRLQYKDQPDGERITIAMEPFLVSSYNPGLFRVVRDDSEPWLGSSWGNSDAFCSADSRWVFCRPRK